MARLGFCVAVSSLLALLAPTGLVLATDADCGAPRILVDGLRPVRMTDETEAEVVIRVPLEVDVEVSAIVLGLANQEEEDAYGTLWNAARRAGSYKEVLRSLAASPDGESPILDQFLATQPSSLTSDSAAATLRPGLAAAIAAYASGDWDGSGAWTKKKFKKAITSLATVARRGRVNSNMGDALQSITSKVAPRTSAAVLVHALAADFAAAQLEAIESDLRGSEALEDPAFARALVSAQEDLRVGRDGWRETTLQIESHFKGDGSSLPEEAVDDLRHGWALAAVHAQFPRIIDNPDWDFQTAVIAATVASSLHDTGSPFAENASMIYYARMVDAVDRRSSGLDSLQDGLSLRDWEQDLRCELNRHTIVQASVAAAPEPEPVTRSLVPDADGHVTRVRGGFIEAKAEASSKLKRGTRVLIVDSTGTEVAEGVVNALVGTTYMIELLRLRGKTTPEVGQLVRVRN